jgi:hypothetical protein
MLPQEDKVVMLLKLPTPQQLSQTYKWTSSVPMNFCYMASFLETHTRYWLTFFGALSFWHFVRPWTDVRIIFVLRK